MKSIPAPSRPLTRVSVEEHNREARCRMEKARGDPFFVAGWKRALFLHYEVEAEQLQREVPFELDLWEGKKAFVSLVAFTIEGMRPFVGGKWTRWTMAPIATHGFLNVRTYVRQGGRSGIYFLREWLSNRLSTRLGPLLFGLPYRHGSTDYDHRPEDGILRGEVRAGDRVLRYRAMSGPSPNLDKLHSVEAGSRDEFLLERYTAFTCLRRRKKRSFQVWHEPWQQSAVDVCIEDDSLIRALGPWALGARLIGANYSPGVDDVWMGRPRRVTA